MAPNDHVEEDIIESVSAAGVTISLVCRRARHVHPGHPDYSIAYGVQTAGWFRVFARLDVAVAYFAARVALLDSEVASAPERV